MNKIYVDEITKNGKQHPQPGPQYNLEPGFGDGCKSGTRYSMRPKNESFEQHLGRQKKLPGPGFYFDDVNLSGKQSAVLNSRLSNQPQNAFPKAQDRFRVTGAKNPAGTDYSPNDNLNQNVKSQFKCSGFTKIGNNRRTFIDINWDPKTKKALPAPGHYNTFSDFSGIH